MVLLVLLLFVIIAAASFVKTSKRQNKLYVAIGVLFVLVAGFRPGDLDYKNYVQAYNWIRMGFTVLIEPTFILISKVSPTESIMFFIYALLGVSLKFIAIRRITELWFLSLSIYLSYFFILHEMTQIRVGIASGILLLSIKPLYERQFKAFLFYVIIAMLFHASAIIMLLLWFFTDKPQILFLRLAIPIAYFVYFLKIDFFRLIPIPLFQSKIDAYIALQEIGNEMASKINVFNILSLFKIGIFYILLLRSSVLQEMNKYALLLLKIQALSIAALPFFSQMPVIAFRISELFGVVEIINIPMLIYLFKPKLLAHWLLLGVALLLLLISVFYLNLII